MEVYIAPTQPTSNWKQGLSLQGALKFSCGHTGEIQCSLLLQLAVADHWILSLVSLVRHWTDLAHNACACVSRVKLRYFLHRTHRMVLVHCFGFLGQHLNSGTSYGVSSPPPSIVYLSSAKLWFDHRQYVVASSNSASDSSHRIATVTTRKLRCFKSQKKESSGAFYDVLSFALLS